MTKTINCNCKHPYQDKRYGKQSRVHNAADGEWRCTVCGDIKKRKEDTKIKSNK